MNFISFVSERGISNIGAADNVSSVYKISGECWLNNYIDRFIDMKGRVKEHRQINHFDGAGNTASFPSKSCKPVSLRKVVTFDQMCF